MAVARSLAMMFPRRRDGNIIDLCKIMRKKKKRLRRVREKVGDGRGKLKSNQKQIARGKLKSNQKQQANKHLLLRSNRLAFLHWRNKFPTLCS